MAKALGCKSQRGWGERISFPQKNDNYKKENSMFYATASSTLAKAKI